MKKFLSIVFLVVCFLGIFSDPVFSEENEVIKSHLGLVKNVSYVDDDTFNNQNPQTKQVVEVKLLQGELKGDTVLIDNMLTGNPVYDILVEKGDKVVLHSEITPSGDYNFFISDIQRTPTIVFLLGLFAFLLLYVGRKKGVFSFLSIFLTCILIFYLLRPLILAGVSPILSTIILCIISTIITMYAIGGFNYKSTSAVLGTSASVIIASLISIITTFTAHLTGFNNESALFLYSAHPELDFHGLVTATIILATLGVVMDISMSISSSINEFYSINSKLSVKELFKSGMNVGCDIIGTMANTLILVYLGGAIPLILLSQELDLLKFFNLNQVSTEIISALIGSISLIICVPLTAIIASFLIKMKKNDVDDIILKKDN